MPVPNLLYQITNCEDFNSLIHAHGAGHPCDLIVNCQRCIGTCQLPEPWSGGIESKVLILGSNPNINPDEFFPDSTWPRNMVADFFINRFAQDRIYNGVDYSWVSSDFRTILRGPVITRSRPVQTWKRTHNRLNNYFDGVYIAGIDYSFMDVVKCKSSAEIGVPEAIEHCTDKFFDFGANGVFTPNLVIALGANVRNRLRKGPFNINISDVWGDQIYDIGGVPMISLPHPVASLPGEYDNHINPNLINDIINIVNADQVNNQNIDYSEIELPTIEEVIQFINGRLNGL